MELNFPLALDEVKQLIPQREPFLFVDSVTERTSNSITTARTFKSSEDFFKGHFPGNPIVPGVILQEALFQSGALLMASGESAGLGVVTRVSQAKFKQMVVPGDTLVMDVELVDQVANAYYFKGKGSVNGKVALVLEFACALT